MASPACGSCCPASAGDTGPLQGDAAALDPASRQGKIKAEMKKKRKRTMKREREGCPLSQGSISGWLATPWGSHPNPGCGEGSPAPARNAGGQQKEKHPDKSTAATAQPKTHAGGLWGWTGQGWDAVPCLRESMVPQTCLSPQKISTCPRCSSSIFSLG